MILDKSGYMEILQNNIATVIRNDSSASITDIDAKLLKLQKEFLKKSNNGEPTTISQMSNSNFRN